MRRHLRPSTDGSRPTPRYDSSRAERRPATTSWHAVRWGS
jgi:hypothetical protein